MCKVSDKLKLCTCKTKNVERLKHYWRLKRPTEKKHCVVGEMILPADIGDRSHKLNQKTILKQLNETNVFDVEIRHEENDILELHFTLTGEYEKYLPLSCNGNYLAYAFKFKKGVWEKVNTIHLK